MDILKQTKTSPRGSLNPNKLPPQNEQYFAAQHTLQNSNVHNSQFHQLFNNYNSAYPVQYNERQLVQANNINTDFTLAQLQSITNDKANKTLPETVVKNVKNLLQIQVLHWKKIISKRHH